MVRGSSNTSSQMTVMNLPVDVEPKTCGRPVRRLRPVRPSMLLESQKFRDLPDWDGLIQSTGGGSRTHTGVCAQRILSPQRLPFRHAGSCGEVSTGRRCHKRKEPGRPGRFAISAGPIRSRSDRSGGTPIHDQHGPHHRYRGIPLQRPIYLAGQRPPPLYPNPWASKAGRYTAADHGTARPSSIIFAGRTSVCGTIHPPTISGSSSTRPSSCLIAHPHRRDFGVDKKPGGDVTSSMT